MAGSLRVQHARLTRGKVTFQWGGEYTSLEEFMRDEPGLASLDAHAWLEDATHVYDCVNLYKLLGPKAVALCTKQWGISKAALAKLGFTYIAAPADIQEALWRYVEQLTPETFGALRIYQEQQAGRLSLEAAREQLHAICVKYRLLKDYARWCAVEKIEPPVGLSSGAGESKGAGESGALAACGGAGTGAGTGSGASAGAGSGTGTASADARGAARSAAGATRLWLPHGVSTMMTASQMRAILASLD